jgi:hypothetical protein
MKLWKTIVREGDQMSSDHMEQSDSVRDSSLVSIMKVATARVREGEDVVDVLTHSLCAAYNAGFQRATPAPATDAKLRADLWIDSKGEAHFTCHTKNEDFESTKEAFQKFIALLQDQVNRERKCPFYSNGVSELLELQSTWFTPEEVKACNQLNQHATTPAPESVDCLLTSEEADLVVGALPLQALPAGLPTCPKCQQGFVCEHCGEPIGDYY